MKSDKVRVMTPRQVGQLASYGVALPPFTTIHEAARTLNDLRQGAKAPRVFEIEFPLPPRSLSPNGSRGHWSKRSGGSKAYRGECEISVIAGKAKNAKLARAKLTIVFGTAPLTVGTRKVSDDRYRPRDRDNAVAAIKPLIDALTTMGAIADDRAECLDYDMPTIDPKRGPGVFVTVTEVA